ncbi:MAG: SLC13/DASS family transporter [Deltaproteobacteria bacterium]|nr:MAG: SLC13/DASS family transporter [Deltaproteobacteria bacterium]
MHSRVRGSSGIKSQVGFYGAPLLALAVILLMGFGPEQRKVSAMAGVAVLMAGWWMTEAIPIPATALLPVVLFPMFGILGGKPTAALYFNHIIFLFLGGFVFALAMQRWDLHRRIALAILRLLGTSPQRMVLGFMVATWFLSMWISNTASTMMMVPMAMAIVVQLRGRYGTERMGRFSVALLLGVAYSASIGGLATLIGTPPNLSLVRILSILFPEAPELSFAGWFLFALPLSTVFLFIAWRLLCWLFLRNLEPFVLDDDVFEQERTELGPMTFEQGAVLVLFVLLVGAWMFRADIDLFGFTVSGWSGLFPEPGFLDDGTVAVGIALLLFLIPSRTKPGERLMDWETASGLPWGIVLLFGGGFALAAGFKESGLSEWLGLQLSALQGAPTPVLLVSICGLLTFLTELSSNTATTEMALPVLGSLAVAIETDPLLLMVPAALSASCAFMLPVATPPNAIVFGSGEVKMGDMIRGGILLNLIGMVLIATAVYFLGPAVLGIEPGHLPAWAQPR